MPCAILENGDDAAAIEASLIENIARLAPDEVTRWETFTRLVKEGRDEADISATFGIPELGVKRILALGNLLPRIREAFRAEEIDAGTVKHLTLATKAQQKAWLALFEDADGYAPRGQQLKAWLFGGASIATSAALFDLAAFDGQIVKDLFGDEGYFADADQFWAAQSAEIERRKAAFRQVMGDRSFELRDLPGRRTGPQPQQGRVEAVSEPNQQTADLHLLQLQQSRQLSPRSSSTSP